MKSKLTENHDWIRVAVTDNANRKLSLIVSRNGEKATGTVDIPPEAMKRAMGAFHALIADKTGGSLGDKMKRLHIHAAQSSNIEDYINGMVAGTKPPATATKTKAPKSFAITAFTTEEKIAQYLRGHGIPCTITDECDEVTDGSISLDERPDIHVQVGQGYAMVSREEERDGDTVFIFEPSRDNTGALLTDLRGVLAGTTPAPTRA
jgi:hypothetical protein